MCILAHGVAWLYWRVWSLPRIPLFTRPTPLERLGKLSRVLGVDVWAKHEDVMELGLGGNKVRKLEFITSYVVSQGYDAVITSGALHSNHARATALAASKLGLEAHIVLYKHMLSATFKVKGNILVEALAGARIYLAESPVEAR